MFPACFSLFLLALRLFLLALNHFKFSYDLFRFFVCLFVFWKGLSTSENSPNSPLISAFVYNF